jgi:hypothetical protein
MTEARITTLLIGILFVGLITTSFGVLIADMNGISSDYTSYSTVSFDNSTLDKYNKLTEIQGLTDTMSDNVQDAKPGTESSADVVGSFFTNAYTSVKTFFQSATYAFSLSNSAFSEVSKAGGNNVLINSAQSVMGLVLIIVFIIGIGLYIIFKQRI